MKHSQYANNLLSIKSGEDSRRENPTFKFYTRCGGPLFWLLVARASYANACEMRRRPSGRAVA